MADTNARRPRRRKRTPIVVESVDQEIDTRKLAPVDVAIRLVEGARILRTHDPERYHRMVALMETYASIYARPNESEQMFQARRRLIARDRQEAN